MYFKRIDICGFKSFAEPVSIDLSNGITCIVGPNGSGKSNVSDAIRWVLGEQSAKTLRGGKMEDVIFAGTAKRRSKGMAEVVLVIDNSKGILPIDYSEVAITRRSFRSGEGEYYINGNQCRLKDIRELIMDTGIGVDGYSLIGQGKIADIVSNKTESRREIFEEAAGIVKYRSKKAEAEKKLEATGLNLSRVNDIISEISERKDSLREESETAKKYLELSSEYKKVEINVTLKNIEDLDLKNEYLKDDLVEIKVEIDDLAEKSNNLTDEIKKGQDELHKLEELLEDARKRKLILVEEITNLRSEDRIKEEKLLFFEKEESRLTLEKDEVSKLLKEKEEESEALNAKLSDISIEVTKLNEEFLEMQKQQVQVLSDSEKLARKIEEKKQEVFTIHGELSSKKTERASLENLIGTLANKRNSLANSAEDEGAISKENTEKYEDLKLDFDRQKVRKEEIQEKLSDEKARRDSLLQSYSASLDELKKLSYSLVQISSRKKTIEEMEYNYDGYNYAVKYVMKKGFSGVEGVLADLITVPVGFELAIETALSAALQNIVCANEETARGIIDILKRERLGRITFLPLSSIRGGAADIPYEVKSAQGFKGLACECVDYDRKFRNIIENQLGRVLVIDNLKNAIEIARKARGFRLVTLEGDVINAGGSITGGAYKNKSANILERKAEITELAQKEEELKHKNDKLEAEVEQLKKTGKESAAEIERIECDLKATELEFITIQNEMKMVADKVANDKSQSDRRIAEIVALEQEEKNTKNSVDELNSQIAWLSDKLNALQAEIEDSINVMEDSKTPEKLVNEELTVLRVRLAESENQKSMLEQNAQNAKKQQEQYAIKMQQNKEAFAKLTEDKKMLFDVSVDMQVLEDKEKQKTALDNYLTEIMQRRQELSNELFDNNKANDEFKNRKNTLAESKYELEIKIAKNETQLENFKNKLWDEFEISYIQASSYKTGDVNFAEAQKTARQLKSRIRALGNVNVGAIEEYKTVSERYTFLETQRSDILKAMTSLRDIIEDMDKTIKMRFKESFDSIVENFEVVFRDLFGGGNAVLEMENPENPLESGIEIIAQPPGKKLQNINLLSGGEKTMTAIALMFAVLRAKPTPFCILDEVEAALDDGNVEKFARYLKKFEDIQFALITHQKVTMEHADVLYGITMPEQGVSKVLSLKLQDREELS